jgi:hypothetical protein
MREAACKVALAAFKVLNIVMAWAIVVAWLALTLGM